MTEQMTEQVLDACETANLKHLERIEQLEAEVEAERQNYCMAFARAEEAEDKLADMSMLCTQLKELCRDLYLAAELPVENIGEIRIRYFSGERRSFNERMDALGLLEVD